MTSRTIARTLSSTSHIRLRSCCALGASRWGCLGEATDLCCNQRCWHPVPSAHVRSRFQLYERSPTKILIRYRLHELSNHQPVSTATSELNIKKMDARAKGILLEWTLLQKLDERDLVVLQLPGQARMRSQVVRAPNQPQKYQPEQSWKF